MRKAWTILFLFALCAIARGQSELQKWDFTVDGVARSALVYLPPETISETTPVVFVFHGHGGSAVQANLSFHMESEWPQAICVYMQGLPTPGQITDPQGLRAGWQGMPGNQGDRDLKFFDAVLARLKSDYKVGSIYSTGHSNGGSFTYLLWLTRGEVFAAVAPSAAAAVYARKLPPKPAMIIGGTKDPLVKFAWQKLTIKAVSKVNGCSKTGQPWNGVCTLYPSPTGTPLVTYIFDGGHKFESAAPGLITKFFQEHP